MKCLVSKVCMGEESTCGDEVECQLHGTYGGNIMQCAAPTGHGKGCLPIPGSLDPSIDKSNNNYKKWKCVYYWPFYYAAKAHL